ncbi:MAG: hypothetical protein Kow00129_01190 [Thermoleophilia bacterium]
MRAAVYKVGAKGGFAGWLTGMGPVRLLGLVLVAYLVVPLLAVPAGLDDGSLGRVWSEAATWKAVGLSVLTASLATLLAALLGVPLGYLLARGDFRGKLLLRLAVMLPLVLPPVVGGLLLLVVFGPTGVIGRYLELVGAHIVNAPAGIVAAQVFVASPFVVLTSEAAFRAVDPAFEEVGAGLGLNRKAIFRRVSLPLAAFGVGGGLALAWLRCLGEFGATAVMAYHPRTLATETWVALSGEGLSGSLPLAALSLLIALLVLAGLYTAGALLTARRRGLAGAAAAERLLPGFPDLRRRSRTLSTEAAETLARPSPVAGSWQKTEEGAALSASVQARVGDFRLEAEVEAAGGILVLLGPSGSGKTTLLRCLAGLHRPEAGSISLGGRLLFQAELGGEAERGSTRPVRSAVVDVPPHERRVVLVPQQPSLFPHRTALGNVLFACEAGGTDGRGSPLALERARRLLAGCGLEGLEHRYPGELSGGQQQRVALARALMVQPDLLLLDEPFSALDAEVRERLREDLIALGRREKVTIVHVTHDLSEALALADRLVLLENGRVIQAGPKSVVAHRPVDERAARLLGVRNLVPAQVIGRSGEAVLVKASSTVLWAYDGGVDLGSPVLLCLREEDVEVEFRSVAPGLGSAGANRFPARVAEVSDRGLHLRLRLLVGDEAEPFELFARVSARAVREAAGSGRSLRAGSVVHVGVPVRSLHVIPRADKADEQRPVPEGYGLPQAAFAPPASAPTSAA